MGMVALTLGTQETQRSVRFRDWHIAWLIAFTSAWSAFLRIFATLATIPLAATQITCGSAPIKTIATTKLQKADIATAKPANLAGPPMRVDRIEFKTNVRMQILRRAGFPENPRCEGCGRSLKGERIEVDHTVECWEMRERRELTANDGRALGAKCCHQPKTARKNGERAHGNRIIKRAAGIKRRSSFKTNRDGPYKMKMDGSIERRG